MNQITGIRGAVVILWAFTFISSTEAALEETVRISERYMHEGSLIGGIWSSSQSEFTQTAVSEKPALMIVGEDNWNDYSICAKVRIKEAGPDSEAGLVFQFADPSFYLVYSISVRKGGPFAVLRIELPNELRLMGDRTKPGERVTFTGDQSWQPNLDLNAWHELRADVHNAEVTCFLDGEPVVNYWFMGTPPPYDQLGPMWPTDPTHGKVGLMARNCPAEFRDCVLKPLRDYSHIVTPNRGLRDKTGMLLPRQSYAETMKRFTEWMIRSPRIVDTRRAPGPVQALPPYLLVSFVTEDDQLWELHFNTERGAEFAFNHSLLINGAVQYYIFSGDRAALEIAQTTADWHLRNLTPSNWAAPHLPPSVVKYLPDGTWVGEEWGLEPDKSAYMGLSLLRLYAVTGQDRYLQGAKNIAQTLRQFQREDGSWPFRINTRTGEVKEGYTCSQLWYVWFFEQLAELTGNKEDLERKEKALQWILKNPVRDNRWIGLYGDVTGGLESYDQWVALETAMYLLDHEDEILGAVQIAEEIIDWVERTLVVNYGLHPRVPGLVEQSAYRVVLTHHQLRYAEAYAKIYEATGKESYKRTAMEIANSVTWCLMSDGKLRLGFWHDAHNVPMVLCFNQQFSRIMSCIPETAPNSENHILRNSAFIREAVYSPNGIRYETVGPGEEYLKVYKKPGTIFVDGAPLPRLEKWGYREEGWWYDESSHLLKVAHRRTRIKINF